MNSLSIIQPSETDIQIVNKKVCVLGIDLGTTNSTVAEVILDEKSTQLPKARCLEIEQLTSEGTYTNHLVPSVLALADNAKLTVGEGAKRLKAKPKEFKQNVNIFYECKNEMGILKTYHKAPEGYKSAKDISSHILKFLYSSALTDLPVPVDRVVVTVPASFGLAQRNDTLNAAKDAGINVKSGDLLDEPIAAFIDYLARNYDSFNLKSKIDSKLLVFDFGGGTCDIAVFMLNPLGKSLEISKLSVSRYHRLGGGDIDRAILYDEIIPQIIEQNDIGEFSNAYRDKKDFVEPSLIAIAEALKIGLCREIANMMKFGKYDTADKAKFFKTQSGTYSFQISDGKLNLKDPKLSAERFEDILQPFLDPDIPYPKENEYRITCSIFAPIKDAIERVGLTADDIDYCLLVGGSSLIPQVQKAIENYFNKASILTYPDIDSTQTAVARGAAYHALSLALYGRGIIQPISNETISIMTTDGLADMVERGESLPFPANNGYQVINLTVPKTSITTPLDLRLEIVAGQDGMVLLSKIWSIPPPVNKGDKLILEYRYDENQFLDLKMYLKDDPESESFTEIVENPLTNVVNPSNKTRQKIADIEEKIRVGKIKGQQEQIKAFIELADDYEEIGQYEKAIHYLLSVLKVKNSPDAGILNKIAICYGRINNYDKEEKFYREAAKATNYWGGAWFNLALLQKRRKKYSDAVSSINKALEIEQDAPPYLVLRSQIYDAMGKHDERDKDIEDAINEFEEPENLSEWSLGWLITAARMVKDDELLNKADDELKKRKVKNGISSLPDSVLPSPEHNIQRV